MTELKDLETWLEQHGFVMRDAFDDVVDREDGSAVPALVQAWQKTTESGGLITVFIGAPS